MLARSLLLPPPSLVFWKLFSTSSFKRALAWRGHDNSIHEKSSFGRDNNNLHSFGFLNSDCRSGVFLDSQSIGFFLWRSHLLRVPEQREVQCVVHEEGGEWSREVPIFMDFLFSSSLQIQFRTFEFPWKRVVISRECTLARSKRGRRCRI